MVRARPLALFPLLLLCLFPAPAAQGQVAPGAFGVGDLLSLERLENARLSPSGRWAVVERRGRRDAAPRFDLQVHGFDAVTDLIVSDDRGDVRVIGADDRFGYRAGPFSPDERRLAVVRFDGWRRELGVLDLEDGTIDWLGQGPELPVRGRTLAWLDAGRLLALTPPEGALPEAFRFGSEPQRLTAEHWRRQAGGQAASVVAHYSGADRDRRGGGAPNRILLHRPGAAPRVLAEGEFFDLEPSPDGRTLAALSHAGHQQPLAGETVTVAFQSRRRRLTLIDLQTGRRSEPLPDHDVLFSLLSWSPRGDRLLVFARPPGRPWSDGDFHLVHPSGRAERLDLGDARPHLSLSPAEKAVIAAGGWAGDRPTVRAILDGEARWAPHGEAPPESPSRRAPESPGLGGAGGRGALNPNPRDLAARARIDPEGCVRPAGNGAPFCPSLSPGGRIVAAAADGRTVLLQTADDQGVSRLIRRTADGEDQTLAEANRRLSEVRWGTVRPVPHADPSGEPLTSWLLLPPGEPPAAGWPLIVHPYPGDRHAAPPPALRPGADQMHFSAQVLAGAGYAVLVPSLPIPESERGDLPGLEAAVDRAVDAALAAAPLDPERIGLLGHSYGGWAVQILAARSERYRAVVSSAGMSDFGAALRENALTRVSASGSIYAASAHGWLETGQGRMGAPPWEDPEAYARASPFLNADAIRTPLMLVWADLDPHAAEILFSALWRLDRTAALVTYFGEGHALTSPANVRDLHARTLDWFDRHMALRGEPVGPAPDP